MPGRTIIHADGNNFYASIEMLHNPKLRGHPVAVGGSVEARHGIILARNYEARAYDVKVGQALWQARQRCPGLIIVPPDYNKYLRFSQKFQDILSDYSPMVEPFGIDEAFADVSGHPTLDGRAIEDEIRERVKFELGITVSVGVSFCKVFAKLASELKKPDGTSVVTENNLRDVVWPLPASDLLGVGRATERKLTNYGIRTIGDIAACDPDILKRWLGKWGLILYSHANGWDTSPVAKIGAGNLIKSVGNSTTCPRDLKNDYDAQIVFQNLSESVAERMREQGLMARTVQISLRDSDLVWFERQAQLPQASHISTELCAAAMELLRQNWKWEKPLRSIGIRGTNLVPIDQPQQLSIFDNPRRERAEKMEYVIDDIRQKFGHYAIDRAMLRLDDKLGKLNPQTDNLDPFGRLA